MANRGYPESDGRFDMAGGAHDVSSGKEYRDDAGYLALTAPTSVGEQVRRGGWTRSDTPLSEDGTLPPDHKYQGGSATGRDRAAYPGTPTPTPGTTY